MNFVCSWSGGKDSCYAFYKAKEGGLAPKVLLNVMNENGDKSRSHGISVAVLNAQASAIGLPIHFFNSSWESYEEKYIDHLQQLEKTYQFTYAVFGDIDIESHKHWEEKVSNKASLKAVLPLWKQERKALVLEMIANGIEAIIVSCNDQLGSGFLGKKITEELLADFEDKGVDVCGENGEYHTLVVNAPFFNAPLEVKHVASLRNNDYNFATIELV